MKKTSKQIEKKIGLVVLVIWDGFGVAKKHLGDATQIARMPVWHRLCRTHVHSLLKASGKWVGLPETHPGNSEAGHETIGAGRVVPGDILTINETIKDKSFYKNPGFLEAVKQVKKNKSVLHLIGLLTEDKSGHASPKHIRALIEMAKQQKVRRVALHIFTDGRDTSPLDAEQLIAHLESELPPNFVIASVMGRFYAMDRNRRWGRTLLAYNAITHGEGVRADSASHAIAQAYNRGETDEFVLPTVICEKDVCVAPVRDNDAVIFWNLRSDRARQMLKPFVEPHFEKLQPEAPKRHAIVKHLYFVTLTEFGKGLDSVVSAFPHHELRDTLLETLRHKKQLYAAESEKFSMVTYFMNGGYDAPKFGEHRLRVESPYVTNYKDRPEMSAKKLTERLLKRIPKHDFITVNYANADMVAHTGDLAATIKACETLDEMLGQIWKSVKENQGTLIVTADHGNAEELKTSYGGKDTEHNPNPVPFLMAGAGARGKKAENGSLIDIAPTILSLFEITPPKIMMGKNLLKKRT